MVGSVTGRRQAPSDQAFPACHHKFRQGQALDTGGFLWDMRLAGSRNGTTGIDPSHPVAAEPHKPPHPAPFLSHPAFRTSPRRLEYFMPWSCFKSSLLLCLMFHLSYDKIGRSPNVWVMCKDITTWWSNLDMRLCMIFASS